MQALEIGELGLVAGFHQGVEAGLDQRGEPSAENRLLAEEVGLGLLFEGRLQHAGHGRADAARVGERAGARLAGRVLVNGEERGHAHPLFEEPADDVAGAFGRDHRDVDVGRRQDLAEVDVEAVGEHQRAAWLQVGLDRLVVQALLRLIGHQHHHEVAQLDGLFHGLHTEVLLLGLLPGLAAFVEADHDIDATVLQVEGVGMPLAAVADDGDPLAGERRHVGVVVVVDPGHQRYVLVVRLLSRGLSPITWSASTGTSITMDWPVVS